jgi:MoxR-like ATPase
MTRQNPPDPSRSCFGCPSLLQPAEATQFFGKTVGTPMCARFGRPIGTMNSTQSQAEKVAKHIAKNCSQWGEPRPASVQWADLNLTVTMPDPDTIGAPRVQPELVTACNGCGNFVRADVVAKDLGWAAGLCAAKGKLLLGNRYTYEARNCEERTFGRVRDTVNNLIMLPEYDDGFQGSNDPVKQHFRNRRNFVDPTEYESDKEVSADDAAHGIRAWRALTDYDTGNVVHLPIYRVDYFSEEEQAKIPRTGDDEHPEDYVDHGGLTYKVAVLWTELDETPGFWGQPGTGKTEFFRYMAWLMCLPFERFSITNSTDLDDLAGKMLFEENQTKYQYGRLPQAWMKPSVIVIDEPNTGPPDVWQFLRPLTDNSKQLVLDMNKGERLKRHDDCYLGMAMNPAWDMRNVGTTQIGDADANRLMHVYVELPPAELEREIIKTACAHDGWDIPAEKLTTVMDIASDIRALTDQGTLNISWAIRPQIKVARALRWFDYVTAYRMATADYLEPQAQQELLDAVRAHVAQ